MKYLSKKGKVKPAKYKRVSHAGQRDLAPVQLSGRYENFYRPGTPDWVLAHREIVEQSLARQGKRRLRVGPRRSR